MSAIDNAYYAARTKASKQRKIMLQDARRRSISASIRAHKASHGCADCPERDPIVLELDHLDPASKIQNVSDLINKGWSLARVMTEVVKCEVVCANCHRRRTAKAFWV